MPPAIVIERYQYDPFGNTTVPLNGATGNRYRFHGSYFDDETGFYHMRARDYSPALGRFLQRDPIGIWTDEPNLGNGLAFVANNPIGQRDPLGLQQGHGCRGLGCLSPGSVVPQKRGHGCPGYGCTSPTMKTRELTNREKILVAAGKKEAFQFGLKTQREDVLDYVKIIRGIKEPEKDPGWSALKELLRITEDEPLQVELNACVEWVDRVLKRYEKYLTDSYDVIGTTNRAKKATEIRQTFKHEVAKWDVGALMILFAACGSEENHVLYPQVRPSTWTLPSSVASGKTAHHFSPCPRELPIHFRRPGHSLVLHAIEDKK